MTEFEPEKGKKDDGEEPKQAADPGPQKDVERRETPPGDPRSEPQPTAEQLHQYQLFQQFQDFLRFQEAHKNNDDAVMPSDVRHPPAPYVTTDAPKTERQTVYARFSSAGDPPQEPPYPPPASAQSPGPKPAVPKWAKKFAGKILSMVLLLIFLVIAGKLAYNHFFPSKPERSAAETGGGSYTQTQLLPKKPYETVRMVYQQVAQGRADMACGLFADNVQQKFAADLGFASCTEAVVALHAKVTHATNYATSIPSTVSGEPTGGSFEISSCAFPIKGGDPLGAFTVTKVELNQWLITDHRPEPNPCPPITTTKPSISFPSRPSTTFGFSGTE